MKKNELLSKLIDRLGPEKVVYVMACGALGGSISIIFGFLTMDKIFTEKEN